MNNIYYTLPNQTIQEISNQIINRLNTLSINHPIITLYGFDEDSHDTWMTNGSWLECIGRRINNSYMALEIPNNNAYIINIKLILQHDTKILIETKNEFGIRTHQPSLNNSGEVWSLYLTSIQELLDIFDIVGQTNLISDNKEEINQDIFNLSIIPFYRKGVKGERKTPTSKGVRMVSKDTTVR